MICTYRYKSVNTGGRIQFLCASGNLHSIFIDIFALVNHIGKHVLLKLYSANSTELIDKNGEIPA